MALNELVIALSLIGAALPTTSGTNDRGPAPEGTPTTRYCLRVDPIIGSGPSGIWDRLLLPEDGQYIGDFE